MKTPDSIFDFINPIVEACSAQLPRSCPSCAKVFSTFKQFICETTPVGAPQALSDAANDPIGILAYVNCECGRTMVLQRENMDMHALFMKTVELPSKRENKPANILPSELRSQVRTHALSLPDSPQA